MIVAIKAAYFNLLGSLRCHNRNDNENVQKAISLISKKKTLPLNHALCYISLPSLNDYDQKLPNFSFIFLWTNTFYWNSTPGGLSSTL